MSATDTAHISRCSTNLGWHAYNAGPCFDTKAEAVEYRDRLAYAGESWWPQSRAWPPLPPDGWVNPVDRQPVNAGPE